MDEWRRRNRTVWAKAEAALATPADEAVPVAEVVDKNDVGVTMSFHLSVPFPVGTKLYASPPDTTRQTAQRCAEICRECYAFVTAEAIEREFGLTPEPPTSEKNRPAGT